MVIIRNYWLTVMHENAKTCLCRVHASDNLHGVFQMSSEMTSRSVLKEELLTAARQIDVFKHEYETLAANLQAEKRAVSLLKVKMLHLFGRTISRERLELEGLFHLFILCSTVLASI